jgi:hypothetical protein
MLIGTSGMKTYDFTYYQINRRDLKIDITFDIFQTVVVKKYE